jgi:hypothetical protein
MTSKEPSAANGQLVHALELVADAEPLADHLERGAGASRGGLPAAEDEQLRAVEARDLLDGTGKGLGHFEGVGESAGRAVEHYQLERHLLADGHHDLLQLGLGAEGHEPDLAAGSTLGQVRGLEQCVAGPRVEDGRKHHLVLQGRTGRALHRLERLERVRDDGAADDDMKTVSHGEPPQGREIRNSKHEIRNKAKKTTEKVTRTMLFLYPRA